MGRRKLADLADELNLASCGFYEGFEIDSRPFYFRETTWVRSNFELEALLLDCQQITIPSPPKKRKKKGRENDHSGVEEILSSGSICEVILLAKNSIKYPAIQYSS